MRIVYIAFGWAGGILLAANFDASLVPLWIGLLLLALIAALISRHNPAARTTCLVLAAFSLAALRFALVPTTSAVAVYNNRGSVEILGVVIAEPDIRDTRTQIQVRAETISIEGQNHATDGIVLVSAPRYIEVAYGDRVSLRGELSAPAEFDTFSYADYLARSGIYSIMNFAQVRVREGGYGDPVFAALLQAKHAAQMAIARYLPEPQAGLLTGILLGNERGISPELDDAFRVVGASHVIAISGFNMVILSQVVMGILDKIGIRKRPAAVIGIAAIAIYTVFVGANAAVVRAAVMSSLLVIAPLFKRKTYVPASLAFIVILMSAFNPMVLWDLSFQLSFFAVLGLSLFADPLSKRFDALLYRLFPRGFAKSVSTVLTEPLIVTIAVQITVLPLIALYFSRVSLLNLPVNLLIVPVQSYLLLLGVLAMLTAFIVPPLAQILFWFTMLLLSWTIEVVRLFAQIPFAEVEFYVDPRLIALLLISIIGGGVLHATQPAWLLRMGRFARSRAVVLATVFSGLGLILLMLSVFLSRPDGKLHIWMLDVGHTNAILLQTPSGAHILIDGGTYPSRLLTALGDHLPFNDREIEMLILTAPDANLYSAIPAVLNRYDAGVVLINGQERLSAGFEALQTSLAEKRVVPVRAGYQISLDDGVQIEVLHPQTTPGEDAAVDDQMMVLRVSYGDFSALFTSELTFVGQEALLAAGQWPQAVVLQVPAHGAEGELSTAFLEAAQPQVALIQSDRANRSGDPDSAILTLLEGIPLFRTDIAGEIHLWTNGTTIWVHQNR